MTSFKSRTNPKCYCAFCNLFQWLTVRLLSILSAAPVFIRGHFQTQSQSPEVLSAFSIIMLMPADTNTLSFNQIKHLLVMLQSLPLQRAVVASAPQVAPLLCHTLHWQPSREIEAGVSILLAATLSSLKFPTVNPECSYCHGWDTCSNSVRLIKDS